MGIRHVKTVAYHSQWNGRAQVAGQQMFEKFRQLHIDEPGRNRYTAEKILMAKRRSLPGPAPADLCRHVPNDLDYQKQIICTKKSKCGSVFVM